MRRCDDADPVTYGAECWHAVCFFRERQRFALAGFGSAREVMLVPHYEHKICYDPVPMMVLSIGHDGTLLDVNAHGLALLRRPRGVLVGAPWTELLAPGEDASDAVLTRECETELRFRANDGETIDVRVTCAPAASELSEREGGPMWLMFGVDVSERNASARALELARNEARAASRAKSTFLASMSHELRTPLNGILGYAQLLAKSALTDEQRRAVRVIQESGEHLMSLIGDVLDLTRIEEGHLELDVATFDLRRMLRTVSELIRVRARQKEIAFVCQLAPDVPRRVRGDASKLRQVLLNLLSNAVKFTELGGVTLRVERSGSARVRFCVVDTGVGIPGSHLRAIFEPFRQAPGSAGPKGTGLGLAISRRLVSLMGGELEVESTEGKGSRFVFEAHLLEVRGRGEEEDARAQVPQGYRGPRQSVVVADDRRENRALLVQVLKPLGFEVIEASNGVEVLDRVAEHQPVAVLMDLVMPVLDGFEATRRLRNNPDTRDLTIIALSASVLKENRQESLGAGCDRFLGKPIRFDALLEALVEEIALDWVFDASDDASLDEDAQGEQAEEDAPSALIAPPAEALEALHRYASQGRIVRVRREIARLRSGLAPEHQPFVHVLAELAGTFQVHEICMLIERHRDA